jgi:hypothetical protein
MKMHIIKYMFIFVGDILWNWYYLAFYTLTSTVVVDAETIVFNSILFWFCD